MKIYICFIFFAAIMFGEAEDKFSFVVIGDRTSDPVENVFSEIIDEISLVHPGFVINVGNLIEGHSEDTTVINAQWDTVLSIIESLPCKFYFVPGSNDIQNEVTRSIYETKTGSRRYYTFDYMNSHFIVLDNSTLSWTPLPSADEEQYNWLVEDLEKHKDDDHIFVFFHTPSYLTELGGQSLLMETFLKYRVRAVFSGGLHRYMYFFEDGTDYIIVGSSGGAMEDNDTAKGNFFHFLFVTVEGKEYDVAIIKKGNLFLRSFVTGSDYVIIQQAQQEVISFPDCIIREGSRKHTYDFTLRVNNTGLDSLVSWLTWNFDSAYYNITPSEIFLQIASDEIQEYKFNLKISDPSKIFPLPQVTTVFPFAYDKICTLKNALGVKRLKNVKRVKSTPTIDGVLEEKLWTELEPILYLGSEDGRSSPIERTELYLGHDQDNLYIAARCYENNLSGLRETAEQHDGPAYQDDNIWFFFDTNLDKETYYQLIVNSRGVAFDRACSFRGGRSTTEIQWNGPWQIKSGREENVWTLEMKIPKTGLEPYDLKQWGFNFRRLQTRINNAGCWCLPFGHNPNNFGIIEFE